METIGGREFYEPANNGGELMPTFDGTPAAVATEPVSLETAKAFLRVDGTADDAVIGLLISAAREKGEAISRLAFLTQTVELVLDAWPDDLTLRLRRAPLQSVTSVTYLDEEGVQATWTDYQVDARSAVGYVTFGSVPSVTLFPTGAIKITYVAGYGDTATSVPSNIQMALLMLIAYWYENRESQDVPKNIRDMFMSARLVWF